MSKRELYKLELSGDTSDQTTNRDSVTVYRKDRNIGRIGFVTMSSWRYSDSHCYRIPDYILRECRAMIENDRAE